VKGFLCGGGYEGIPLEVHAYGLGTRFEASPQQRFAVSDEVLDWFGRADIEVVERKTNHCCLVNEPPRSCNVAVQSHAGFLASLLRLRSSPKVPHSLECLRNLGLRAGHGSFGEPDCSFPNDRAEKLCSLQCRSPPDSGFLNADGATTILLGNHPDPQREKRIGRAG
jgi:hypothetical protein